MINEDKLLHNLKNKKRNCLDTVIKLYTPYVNIIVYNTVGNLLSREDIEEVISDTFLSLWYHADSVSKDKGSIRAYLGAIARNTAKNKLRGYRNCETLDENTESHLNGPQEIIIKKEEKTFLMDRVIELGGTDSEVFFRYYYYNEKIKDIAAAMNIPVSTVKTKLSRGKKKLKKTIIQMEDLT